MKIEGNILAGLSDFIPRNQNQIIDLIGKNHEKSTDKVHVYRALKQLKPYLKRSPNGLDELGKKWTIMLDTGTLSQAVKNYPSIIPYLQKNKTIVSMFAIEQNLFVKHYPDSLELKTAKKMLSLSWSFFENYVRNANFLDIFCELWLEAHHEEMDEDNITIDYKTETKYERFMGDGEKFIFSRKTSPIFEILTNAFEHSMITDRMNNVYNPKSLDYLKTTFKPGMTTCFPEKPSFKSRSEVLKEFRKTGSGYVIIPI